MAKINIDQLNAIVNHMQEQYGKGMIKDTIYGFSIDAEHEDGVYADFYRDMEELLAVLFPDCDWVENREFNIPIPPKDKS